MRSLTQPFGETLGHGGWRSDRRQGWRCWTRREVESWRESRAGAGVVQCDKGLGSGTRETSR